MNVHDELTATVQAMVRSGKGILAADESAPTIAKRFQAIALEPTEENRCAYRSLIVGTPGLGELISAVILFEETLLQRDAAGTALPEVAARQGIVPGVKVDAGKGPLALAPGDEVTHGLDGLAKRLEGYKKSGARFAKWRAVYNVSASLPGRAAIEANAYALARYAAICQEQGVVPIVEPEVLIDGDHSLGVAPRSPRRCCTKSSMSWSASASCSSTSCSNRAWSCPARRTPDRRHPTTWRRTRCACCGAAFRPRCRASTSSPVARCHPRRRPTSTR